MPEASSNESGNELGNEVDDVVFEWSEVACYRSADDQKISTESSASESEYRHALEVCLIMPDIQRLTHTTK